MRGQTDSTRRRFLTGASVTLRTALAGCSQQGIDRFTDR